MMCGHRSWHAHTATLEQPSRPGHERVTDHDRDRVASLVNTAFAEGLLDIDELDERLGHAYGARTAADLERVTADLPRGWVRAQRQRRRSERERRVAVAAYLRMMAFLVTVWLVIGLLAGAWYPWPVWPALGWGIPLFLAWRAHAPRRRARARRA